MVKKMSHYAIRLKIILLLVSLLLSQVNATTLDTDPRNQRMVQIAVTDIPYSLSPFAMSKPIDAQYSHLFFDPLVRWGKEKKLEYRLLEKLESLNNGKTRFYLKQNIYFHSGNLLTSKDVVWSFNAALNNKYLNRQLQHNIKLTRINDYQFDIQTKLTQAQLLDYISHLFILDSRYYKQHKIKHNTAQATLLSPITKLPLSGTGPYRVAAFSSEINLRVVANPTYWDNPPSMKSLNFIKIKSTDSRLYALLAGDIDISEAIPCKNINSVELLETKEIYQTKPFNGLFLVINENKNTLFERESTRNAIHLAINQEGMLRYILNGTGSIGRTLNIATNDVKAPIYNARRAKYLLQKIDMPKHLSLLVMEGGDFQSEEIIMALENMFKKIGISLDVTKVSSRALWNASQSDYDLMLASWRSPLINTDNLHQDIFTNSYLSNYIQSLINKQAKGLSMEDKVNLFRQYQLSDRIIPLFSKNNIWATDKQFDLQRVFSVNGIAYWHLLTLRN